MVLGLDFHGVIDKNPKEYGELSRIVMMTGGRVYVITGTKATPEFKKTLESLGIVYTDILSIVDYHLSLGTIITYDGVGNPWLDNKTWDKTKADFCEKYCVDLHIDDSKVYGQYFKGKTKYLLVQ